MRSSNQGVIWRKKVYDRDSYTCRLCGCKISGELQAHHIFKISDYEELAFDVDNGITLCKRCHRFINCNEELWQDELFGMVLNG